MQRPNQEWAIWRDVPPHFSGVWRTVAVSGWTYLGGFQRGTLVCGMGLDATTDADTIDAWLAMIELTTACHEPRQAPVLPIRPTLIAASPRDAGAAG